MKLLRTAPSWRLQLRAIDFLPRAEGTTFRTRDTITKSQKNTTSCIKKISHCGDNLITILSVFTAAMLKGHFAACSPSSRKKVSRIVIYLSLPLVMAIQAVISPRAECTAPTSLIRPIGIPVFPILGQLLGLKAVGEHASKPGASPSAWIQMPGGGHPATTWDARCGRHRASTG